MPYITVQTDTDTEREDAVMLCERITLSDLESPHFCAQLVERLQWATRDAHTREVAMARAADPDQAPASVLTTASYTPAP